jgi:hypothetical protein
MDLGQGRRGVDVGPSAIRYANLSATLEDLGYAVADLENLLRFSAGILEDFVGVEGPLTNALVPVVGPADREPVRVSHLDLLVAKVERWPPVLVEACEPETGHARRPGCTATATHRRRAPTA